MENTENHAPPPNPQTSFSLNKKIHVKSQMQLRKTNGIVFPN